MSKVTWFEVMGPDAAKTRAFYTDVFGWKIEDMPGGSYGVVKDGDTAVGGIGEGPAAWTTFYITVDNIDAAMDKASKLGSNVLLPRMELPDASIAVMTDPNGQAIGLVQTKAA